MDPIFKPVDTFATTFSTDQYADTLASPKQDFSFNDASPTAVPQDHSTPHSSHSGQNRKSSTPNENAVAPPNSAGLNPRSCVTCRRRKVKCDKKQPCSNCQKASIECVFPRPGRAPRKSKKPPDAELLARLRRLEGVVQRLGKGADGEDLSSESRSPDESKNDANGPGDQAHRAPKVEHAEPANDTPSHLKETYCPGRDIEMLKNRASIGEHGPPFTLDKEIGRLVIGEGKSVYVSNSFWASLTTEISEMKDILVQASSDEEDEGEDESASPESSGHGSQTSRITHQEFIFGYSSNMMTLRILHPPASQIMSYWGLFKTHVDPVLRIFHKPTLEHLFQKAAQDQSTLTKSEEALAFAVYFSVFTALSPDECRTRLLLDKDTGIKRYRYATEQALSRAGFLSTQEILLVQAFVLYLCCVRRHDDTKPVWTMTGLLVRMAFSLGIHRDGEKFGLGPYDTEMRRRLWWQICTLDVRSSEDQGADAMIVDKWFDTKMPLNINDEDIWPDMKDPPQVRDGCTEMTFDLVRYEIGYTIRKLSKMQKCPNQEKWPSLQIKESLLEALRLRLEDKYLRHCNMNDPLQWVAANVSRLVMAKIWLVIHHPLKNVPAADVSDAIRDRIFLTSIDVIRFSRLIETQQKSMKWGWLFKSYFQWHAVAFLLTELCKRTEGQAVEDGWAILDEGFPEWEKDLAHKKSVLWKPIMRLLAKARAIRHEALEKRRMFPADGTLGPMTNLSSINSQNIPSVSHNSQNFNPLPIPSFGTGTAQPMDSEMADMMLANDNSILDIEGMGTWLADPHGFEPESFETEGLSWGSWDEALAKEFPPGNTPPPMDFQVGAMWGAG